MRVGVLWVAVEPAPGQYDDAYLDSIAAMATASFMSVIAPSLLGSSEDQQ